MKQIVYLIGPPCAGKSTLLKQWKQAGGQVVPEFMEPVPEFVHNSWMGDQDTKLKAQQWAYGQNVRKDELISSIQTDEMILVERSALDVLVYSRAAGGEVARWTEAVISGRKWNEGKVVMLSSDYEVLKQRWQLDRGLSAQDWDQQWLPLSIALQKYYSELHDLYGIPRISTEGSLEETMRKLHEAIEQSPNFSFEGMIYPSLGKERK